MLRTVLSMKPLQVSPAFWKFPLYHLAFTKIYISTCFCQPKDIWRGCLLLRKVSVESENSVPCFAGSCYRGSVQSEAWVWLLPRNYTHHFSTKLPWLWAMWASVLYLDLFCAFFSKMWPKVTAALCHCSLWKISQE